MATHCTSCGFDNPPGMRFCGSCGTRLDAAPAEVTTDGLGIMIGADLAQRLRRAGIEAAGQRRSVTVLFTDLSGYTSFSQRMDSEDVYDLVQRYMRILIDNVYNYEGIVDKLTGDGLMALFGAPISLENNAERAVRAALDMQAEVKALGREMREQFGEELQMRVGLHSGAVVVGGVGTNLLMNYTAIGDTVNLARRIEEAAPSGSILVSSAVERQVRSLFEMRPVEALSLKGIAQPVSAFQVLGHKEQPGRLRGVEGLHAPMIGRDREILQLQAALDRLLSQSTGQLVFITGEAGLGKSRLTGEFKAGLAGLPLRVLEGQSLAYRRSAPYWIFQDLVRSSLGVKANTSPLVIREKLSSRLYAVLGSKAGEALTYLEHMLSLPYSDPQAGERLRYLDAGQLRKQMFIALRDMLVAEAALAPLVIVLEDLHWADDASVEMLRFLLDSLRTSPVFVLGVTRAILPGTMADIVAWGEAHLGENCVHIQLNSLSLDHSEELLSRLLAMAQLPPEVRTQIHQRAAGIPFYLEEILRMLIDDGALRRTAQGWELVPGQESAAQGVPTSLQELVLARFDRLGPSLRRVLEIASVIGKDFSLPVLSAVLQPHNPLELREDLEQLTGREFIQPQPGEQDLDFSFRHILMSDAIYATLLRRERTELHGRVAAAIEYLYADHLDSQVELLAYHYRLSPRLDRALHFLILSGEKSARSFANEQARQHFEAGLELLSQVEHSAEQAMRVRLGLGDALLTAGDYQAAREQYLDSLAAVPEEHVDACELRSTLHRKIARTCERQGNHEEALNHLAAAREALDCSASPYPEEGAKILNDLGWLHLRRGSFPEAQEHFEQALALVESGTAYDVIAAIYNRLSGVAYYQGNWSTSADYLRKSIALRESIHDLAGLASSFNNLGNLEVDLGQYEAALDHLTRCYELNARLGQAEGLAAALSNLGWLRTLRGELEQAGEDLDNALDLARSIGYTSLVRIIRRNLAELYLAANRWEDARRALEEAAPSVRELNSNDQLVDLYRLSGEASLGAGDLEEAGSWAGQAEALVASLEDEEKELSTMQRGELRRFQARLATCRGQWDQARRLLEEGLEIFSRLESRLYTGRIYHSLGQLAEAKGDYQEAREQYGRATSLFESIGAHLEAQRAEQAAAAAAKQLAG